MEGRTAADAAYWLAQAAPAWRDAIRVVAIDMCSIYASAVRRMLPGARIAVDLFHMVHLAVKMTGDVRRHAVCTPSACRLHSVVVYLFLWLPGNQEARKERDERGRRQMGTTRRSTRRRKLAKATAAVSAVLMAGGIAARRPAPLGRHQRMPG